MSTESIPGLIPDMPPEIKNTEEESRQQAWLLRSRTRQEELRVLRERLRVIAARGIKDRLQAALFQRGEKDLIAARIEHIENEEELDSLSNQK